MMEDAMLRCKRAYRAEVLCTANGSPFLGEWKGCGSRSVHIPPPCPARTYSDPLNGRWWRTGTMMASSAITHNTYICALLALMTTDVLLTSHSDVGLIGWDHTISVQPRLWGCALIQLRSRPHCCMCDGASSITARGGLSWKGREGERKEGRLGKRVSAWSAVLFCITC